jgi:aerobic-type carbon monoxide dehydrogenase small subunit (CoxS/CutS family)
LGLPAIHPSLTRLLVVVLYQCRCEGGTISALPACLAQRGSNRQLQVAGWTSGMQCMCASYS